VTLRLGGVTRAGAGGRLAEAATVDDAPPGDPLAAFCAATGGACASVTSLRGLLAWADALAARAGGTPPLVASVDVVRRSWRPSRSPSAVNV